MADTDEALPSVFEFAADVSTQEAPPPLPARTYPAQCTGAKAQRSKSNPDNIILGLEFSIDPSVYPADYTEVKDVTKLYFQRIPINKDDARTRFQIRKLCETMRVPVSRQLDVNGFVGKMVNLKVKHGEWQGIKRAEIDAIEAPGS